LDRVISADGTPFAYHRLGSGPPLLLVPGSGAANPIAWTNVIPTLLKHFTVYAVDRRGRGESGDSPTYTIEREFEDIAAVVEATGEPANLLGHSFGALCALEAALLTSSVRRLILYEPAFTLPGVTLYQEVAQIPEDEIEQLKATPAWATRLATAHTLPREARAEDEYTFDGQRFRRLHVPTLLLAGSESPPFLQAAMRALDDSLPNSRIAILPGQQHLAMYTAPELFLETILPFLLAREDMLTGLENGSPP
jgi:pimeloyl-ACP methyl ester carboxylesterase